MSGKVTNFITEVAAHFPPRQADEPTTQAWLNSMTRELSIFDADVLAEAARTIVRTRSGDKARSRLFPSLGDCIRACEDVLEWKRRKEAPKLFSAEGEEASPWSKARRTRAWMLVKTELGRRAARENPCWVLQLWDFCRNHGRHPEPNEIEMLKREAGIFEQTYRDLLRGTVTSREGEIRSLTGALQPVLIRLGDGFIEKRKQLCAEVLGQ